MLCTPRPHTVLENCLQEEGLPHLSHLLTGTRDGRLRNNPVDQSRATATRLVGVHVNPVITAGGGRKSVFRGLINELTLRDWDSER